MNRDSQESLSTADLANAAEARNARREHEMKHDSREAAKHEARAAHEAAEHDSREAHHANEGDLAPLFPPNVANDFRSRWDQVQFSFVDDPRRAVREGDELVAQVMKCLAQGFSEERARLEQQLGQTDAGSTESLRMALRRYRSFFQRLLSL
jgi:hypothetical protein